MTEPKPNGAGAISGVYAIVDLPYPHPLDPVAIVAGLIGGGVGVVQLRAKSADPAQRRAWLEAIAETCASARVPLIVNDDLELAEAGVPGVVGVHLGQGDLDSLGPDSESRRRRRARLRERGLVLGVSTHSPAQVRATLDSLAPDYLGFGPVFPTTSKLDHDPIVGVETLAVVCGDSPVPIVAIGGIDVARANQLAHVGVAAIAAIGALVGADVAQIQTAAIALRQAFER